MKMTLGEAFRGVTRNPWDTFIRCWNWKSALLSSLFRGGLFFTVNLSAGWEAAVGALLAEFAYRASLSGLYGSLTQSLQKVEPAWHGAFTAVLILPIFQHSIELLIHWLRGTPNLSASILASAAFTVLSTLFNLYAMRRGALIVGAGQRPLVEDLKAIPFVVAGFLLTGVELLRRGVALARGSLE